LAHYDAVGWEPSTASKADIKWYRVAIYNPKVFDLPVTVHPIIGTLMTLAALDRFLLKQNRILLYSFIKPVFWFAALFVIFLAQDVSAHSNHLVVEQIEQDENSNTQVQVLAGFASLSQLTGNTDPYCCHTDDSGVTCSSSSIGLASASNFDCNLGGTYLADNVFSFNLGISHIPPSPPPIL
jgi:hypothetical protein